MSGKRGRGRSRLTFENIVPKILKDGHVISMRTPRRAYMNKVTTVDELQAFFASFSLSTPLENPREAILNQDMFSLNLQLSYLL